MAEDVGKKRTPPGSDDASRGGKRTQELLRSRGEHPLAARNFWAVATAAQRRRHRVALSARRLASSACRAVRAYQGEDPPGNETETAES